MVVRYFVVFSTLTDLFNSSCRFITYSRNDQKQYSDLLIDNDCIFRRNSGNLSKRFSTRPGQMFSNAKRKLKKETFIIAHSEVQDECDVGFNSLFSIALGMHISQINNNYLPGNRHLVWQHYLCLECD